MHGVLVARQPGKNPVHLVVLLAVLVKGAGKRVTSLQDELKQQRLVEVVVHGLFYGHPIDKVIGNGFINNPGRVVAEKHIFVVPGNVLTLNFEVAAVLDCDVVVYVFLNNLSEVAAFKVEALLC